MSKAADSSVDAATAASVLEERTPASYATLADTNGPGPDSPSVRLPIPQLPYP